MKFSLHISDILTSLEILLYFVRRATMRWRKSIKDY